MKKVGLDVLKGSKSISVPFIALVAGPGVFLGVAVLWMRTSAGIPREVLCDNEKTNFN